MDAVIVWRAWVLCSDQRRIVLVIPVVMLGINTGAISSHFIFPAVTCPFAYILAIYLTTVVLRAIELISDSSLQMLNRLIHMINATQVTQLTFSLLINIYATSVIALKAWCVIFGGVFKEYVVDFALMDDMTHAYIQEIP